MIKFLITTLAQVIHIYSDLCIIRIFLTWIPQINYSSIGRIFSSICDPYLNLFSRLPLRIGMIDFTAIVALTGLYLAESILGSISQTGFISLSVILSHLLLACWSIVSSLLIIFFLICLIRYLVSIFYKQSNNYNSRWQILDNAIRNYVFKLCHPFTFRKPISYNTALLLDSFILLFSIFLIRFLVGLLLFAIGFIPF